MKIYIKYVFFFIEKNLRSFSFINLLEVLFILTIYKIRKAVMEKK